MPSLHAAVSPLTASPTVLALVVGTRRNSADRASTSDVTVVCVTVAGASMASHSACVEKLVSVQKASLIGNQCDSCKQLASVVWAGLLQNASSDGGVHTF